MVALNNFDVLKLKILGRCPKMKQVESDTDKVDIIGIHTCTPAGEHVACCTNCRYHILCRVSPRS